MMNWLSCFSCKKKTSEDVKTLDFNSCSLKEVPPEIFNFERTLENLHLDGNKITELPRTLFHCEELRHLDLSDNEIQLLPTLISKLVNLQTLNISRNCLKYNDIPNNIQRCQKLMVLDLSSNILEKVPEGPTSLVNLQELYLNDTYIEYFPANFGRLSNLRILELRDNNLSTLPKSLHRLTSLKRLDLSNNDFAEMPEAIGQMTNLQELWINGNCISEIDKSISNLQNLLDFDASKNDIESLPNEIGSCTKLTSLILSNNLLNDVPNVLGKLVQLQTLKLDFNYIKSLPYDLGELVNLEELDVQNNQLSSLPNSIGFLRKLNYLVLSHNFLSTLPSEIGSCISLTIINMHNNMLKKLPEEIGHLQKLTSLGLIGNKLEYLPIPLANLPYLRALWLTQNQSHPLIPLQTEKLNATGQLVLTCFLLPQIQLPPEAPKTVSSMPSSKRHICFNEQVLPPDQPTRLTRAPTPYPKDLQRYQRYLNNQLRRNREVSAPNVNTDQYISEIREAKVTPMKSEEEEYQEHLKMNHNLSTKSEIYGGHRAPVYDNTDKFYDKSKLESNYNVSYPNEHYEAADKYEKSDSSTEGFVEFSEGKKRPPPYHIAAAYSKNAHFFNKMDHYDGAMDKPKNFTQELPKNISMPQPVHYNKRVNPEEKYLVDEMNQCFVSVPQQLENNYSNDQNNFQGGDKHPILLHVDLTPCCYVLGFTVSYNENGVFVNKVDENGNAFQKLFPGDRILMLDKQDLTKMDPWHAYKTVLIQGPEAESFFISRT